MENTQITIKQLSNGAIACENERGAMVAWITPAGAGPVFDPLAEIDGPSSVDYPELFKSLGLNNLTIRQIANCRVPGADKEVQSVRTERRK